MQERQPSRRRRSIWVPVLWALILGAALYVVFTGGEHNPADSASPAPASAPTPPPQGVTPRAGGIPAKPALTAEVVRVTVTDAAKHEVTVDYAAESVTTVDHPPLYACAYVDKDGLHEPPEGGLSLPARMTLHGFWDLVEFIPGEREVWRVSPLDKTLTSIGAYFRAHGELPADAFGLMEKDGITSLDLFASLDAAAQRTMLLPYLNYFARRIVRLNPKSAAVPGDIYLRPLTGGAPDSPTLREFLRANPQLDRAHPFALTLYGDGGLLLEATFFPLK